MDVKVKKLPQSVIKDIQLKNHARKLAGLEPIIITTKECRMCKRMFESAGNVTCGCNTKDSNYIAGREII